MGLREKKLKGANARESSSSEEETKRKVKTLIEAISYDEDEEANEDLSLKIVQKAMLRARSDDPPNDGVSEIVVDLKHDKKRNEKRKRKKSKDIEVPEDAVSSELDPGFKDFCGELFLLDNVKDEEKETEKAEEISDKALGTTVVEVPGNAVLRKLLRGPRYFDPPDNSWGACYNCGEEGHTTVNCTSARRKKPCFVCGSFDHNAKQCSKGRDCFICRQQGHVAKDCPEKNRSSRICLKCGDLGHDMFSCRNVYSPNDLKEIQCYICKEYGHLCCVNYGEPGPIEVSCYKCGVSGHTGLACPWSLGDTNVTASANSCYNCGCEGHFARECTSSVKVGKRNRESSMLKQRSSKNTDHIEVRSAPHDLGKARKKKRSQHGEFMSSTKARHKGGWITEDPGDFYTNKRNSNNWRSPATPKDRRSKAYSLNSDYASASRSSKRHHDFEFSNSTSNGLARFYPHTFSASRFGNNSNGGMAGNYNWRHFRD